METPFQTEKPRGRSPQSGGDSSRFERIGDHLAGISEDARDLVNLKVAMARNNVEEKVDEARSAVGKVQITAAIVQETIRYYIPAVILAVVGLLFVLTTLGLFLGRVLGSYWMGFGIVTGAVFLAAGVYYTMGRRAQRRIVVRHESDVRRPQLPEDPDD